MSRSEAIAERRSWSNETKLDNLLPNYRVKKVTVFTQLPRHTLSDYDAPIKELNSRFRMVEVKKHLLLRSSKEHRSLGKQPKNLQQS